jgi:hypothetical protein
MCALGRDRVLAMVSVPPERTLAEEEDVAIAPTNQTVRVRYMGVGTRLLVFLIDYMYHAAIFYYISSFVPTIATLINIWWFSSCFAWGSPGVLVMG